MADMNQKHGLTGAGAALLGLAVYGAYQWRKTQQAKGTGSGSASTPTQPGPIGN